MTGDGTKRILISRTQNYQAVVDLTEVSKDKFTYKRLGKINWGMMLKFTWNTSLITGKISFYKWT